MGSLRAVLWRLPGVKKGVIGPSPWHDSILCCMSATAISSIGLWTGPMFDTRKASRLRACMTGRLVSIREEKDQSSRQWRPMALRRPWRAARTSAAVAGLLKSSPALSTVFDTSGRSTVESVGAVTKSSPPRKSTGWHHATAAPSKKKTNLIQNVQLTKTQTRGSSRTQSGPAAMARPSGLSLTVAPTHERRPKKATRLFVLWDPDRLPVQKNRRK